jgi:hypothetical protein
LNQFFFSEKKNSIRFCSENLKVFHQGVADELAPERHGKSALMGIPMLKEIGYFRTMFLIQEMP